MLQQSVDTCRPPKIQNTMMNQTVVPGEYAHFKCQVHKMNVDFIRVYRKGFCSIFVFSQIGSIHFLAKYFRLSDVSATDSEVVINISFLLCPQHIMSFSFGLPYDCFQVDMSKCMVAFIDWYHERFDGEGGREKIKVTIIKC